jgi:hypothetical protein
LICANIDVDEKADITNMAGFYQSLEDQMFKITKVFDTNVTEQIEFVDEFLTNSKTTATIIKKIKLQMKKDEKEKEKLAKKAEKQSKPKAAAAAKNKNKNTDDDDNTMINELVMLANNMAIKDTKNPIVDVDVDVNVNVSDPIVVNVNVSDPIVTDPDTTYIVTDIVAVTENIKAVKEKVVKNKKTTTKKPTVNAVKEKVVKEKVVKEKVVKEKVVKNKKTTTKKPTVNASTLPPHTPELVHQNNDISEYDEEDELDVVPFMINGSEYLIDTDLNIYSKDEHELLGTYDKTLNTLIKI